jgi:DNA-binding response OmpR family regulator
MRHQVVTGVLCLGCQAHRANCVKIASSGYTAMKMLEEAWVAAVLLEYKLEGMDAAGVACHIKHLFPHLSIILLSARDARANPVVGG